eukprot:757828-Hanusia_phi.AAC.6
MVLVMPDNREVDIQTSQQHRHEHHLQHPHAAARRLAALPRESRRRCCGKKPSRCRGIVWRSDESCRKDRRGERGDAGKGRGGDGGMGMVIARGERKNRR